MPARNAGVQKYRFTDQNTTARDRVSAAKCIPIASKCFASTFFQQRLFLPAARFDAPRRTLLKPLRVYFRTAYAVLPLVTSHHKQDGSKFIAVAKLAALKS